MMASGGDDDSAPDPVAGGCGAVVGDAAGVVAVVVGDAVGTGVAGEAVADGVGVGVAFVGSGPVGAGCVMGVDAALQNVRPASAGTTCTVATSVSKPLNEPSAFCWESK